MACAGCLDWLDEDNHPHKCYGCKLEYCGICIISHELDCKEVVAIERQKKLRERKRLKRRRRSERRSERRNRRAQEKKGQERVHVDDDADEEFIIYIFN